MKPRKPKPFIIWTRLFPGKLMLFKQMHKWHVFRRYEKLEDAEEAIGHLRHARGDLWLYQIADRKPINDPPAVG